MSNPLVRPALPSITAVPPDVLMRYQPGVPLFEAFTLLGSVGDSTPFDAAGANGDAHVHVPRRTEPPGTAVPGPAGCAALLSYSLTTAALPHAVVLASSLALRNAVE